MEFNGFQLISGAIDLAAQRALIETVLAGARAAPFYRPTTPSAFSITFGVLPSMMATHELVVPRSMPIILLI